MAKAVNDAGGLGRGRPRIDAVPLTVRMPPAQLEALDTWIAKHPDPKPSRPEAIRKILAEYLPGGGHLRLRRDLRPAMRRGVHLHKASDEASSLDTPPHMEDSGDVIGEP